MHPSENILAILKKHFPSWFISLPNSRGNILVCDKEVEWPQTQEGLGRLLGYPHPGAHLLPVRILASFNCTYKGKQVSALGFAAPSRDSLQEFEARWQRYILESLQPRLSQPLSTNITYSNPNDLSLECSECQGPQYRQYAISLCLGLTLGTLAALAVIKIKKMIQYS
jgi:hypothetical protein